MVVGRGTGKLARLHPPHRGEREAAMTPGRSHHLKKGGGKSASSEGAVVSQPPRGTLAAGCSKFSNFERQRVVFVVTSVSEWTSFGVNRAGGTATRSGRGWARREGGFALLMTITLLAF